MSVQLAQMHNLQLSSQSMAPPQRARDSCFVDCEDAIYKKAFMQPMQTNVSHCGVC